MMRPIPITCDPEGRLRRVPLTTLQRFQGHLKILHEAQYHQLRESIEQKGFFAPIFLWAGHNFILDGHQRLNVLEREIGLGHWQLAGDGLPVVEIEAADEKDAAEKLLLLSSTYGKIDPQGLYEFTELHEIPLVDFTLPDLPDFDLEAYQAEYYQEAADQGHSDPDAIPEPPVKPTTQPGDLWLLGDHHRLLCGDATNAADVERLMRGEQTDLGVTSPPYAVGKEYEAGISFASHLQLLEGVADRGLTAIKPGGFFFVNFDEIASQAHAGPLTGSERQCLYLISRDYYRIFHDVRRYDLHDMRIWYKPFNRLQQPFWSYHTSIAHHQEWEHLWTWRLPGGGKELCFDWDISVHAVWDTRNEATDDKPLTRHVAAFPVGLPERAIKAHSAAGALIWEPFAGSGTTLVAASRLKRRCFALELQPAYGDVIVQRWQDYTGQAARLDGDGRTFAELSSIRCLSKEEDR